MPDISNWHYSNDSHLRVTMQRLWNQ